MTDLCTFAQTAEQNAGRKTNNEQSTSIGWDRFHRSADNSLHHPEAVRHYHMVMVVGVVSTMDISDIVGDFSGHCITCRRKERWTRLNFLRNNIECVKL